MDPAGSARRCDLRSDPSPENQHGAPQEKTDLRSGLEREQGALARLRTEYTSLTTQHTDALAQVRRDAEEDTKAVLKSAMQTLQVLADEQQVVINKAQQEYGDDQPVLAALMLVDHTNSQFNRRAQGVAVLCGGWLGRRTAVASVYDVARSAQGRIKHFDRVSIHTQVNASVTSKAVEPVAVVLAELLANATNSSAPGTPVEINIQAVPTGVCLIVDDAGVGMSQEEKDRATALLSAQGPVDITSLGNPPRFGFAVSGVLANRYGFKVSVDSVSPYGGVRAVILLPESLLTDQTPEPLPGSAAQGNTRDARDAASAQREPQRDTPVSAPVTVRSIGTTSGGLPKRRRIGAVSVVPDPEMPAPEPGPESETSGEVTASRLGAFQRGTQLGRDTTTMEGSRNQ